MWLDISGILDLNDENMDETISAIDTITLRIWAPLSERASNAMLRCCNIPGTQNISSATPLALSNGAII